MKDEHWDERVKNEFNELQKMEQQESSCERIEGVGILCAFYYFFVDVVA